MTKKKDAAPPQSTAISFPKDLLQSPPTQLQAYEDAVAGRVRELDARASQLARGFGIGYSPGVHLQEAAEYEGTEVLLLLGKMLIPTQRVSLEKVNGNWGLVYTYEPGVVKMGNDRGMRVPLRDAPLDVREKFLRRSEEFFRRYLDSCKDRLAGMKDAVSAGDRTLELLQRIQLT